MTEITFYWHNSFFIELSNNIHHFHSRFKYYVMQPNCCKNENCDSQKRISCTIINSSGQAKFYFFFAKIGHVDQRCLSSESICCILEYAYFLTIFFEGIQYFFLLQIYLNINHPCQIIMCWIDWTISEAGTYYTYFWVFLPLPGTAT